MNARQLVRGLVASSLVVAMSASILVAQPGAYKRLKLIEEFTSATCGPCTLATPIMNGVVDIKKGVVSIRYHMDYPAPGDPFNVANPNDASTRHSFYGVNGIPYGTVQGTTPVQLTVNTTQGIIAVNNVLSQVTPTTPVMMTAEQIGPDLKITVKSDVALGGHTLHCVIVNRDVSLPTLPSTLPNSNGEKTFEDVMMKMYPDANGTKISLAAGETKVFNFRGALGTGDIWPNDKQYIIAFVQTDATKDVLQAAVSNDGNTPVDYAYLKATDVAASLSGLYNKVGRGATVEKTITLKNNGSTPATITLNVANAATLQTNNGMTAVIEPATQTIPAGATQTATLKVTGTANASTFAGVNIGMSAEDALGRTVPSTYYLVDGAKVISWYGVGNGQEVLTAVGVQASTYGVDHAFVPFNTEAIAAYPPNSFAANVINMDGAWLNFRGTILTETQKILAAKKGVWVSGQDNLFAAYERYLTNPAFTATRTFMEGTVGVQLDHHTWRLTFDASGNPTSIIGFSAKGVAKDPIGDGLSLTMNNANSSWPYYASGSDVMKKSAGSRAKTFLYYSDRADSIAGVHTEPIAGGRIVYTSAGPETMATQSQRNTYTQKVLDWLINGTTAAGTITVSQSTLSFGSVIVDETKDMTVDFTNTSAVPVKLSDILISGTDGTQFDVIDGRPDAGPITIAPGAKHTLTVRFAPTVKKASFVATLTGETDATTNPVVNLRGSSQIVSVETEVLSEFGAIGMRLVGSNPVTDASAIELTTSGSNTGAVTVSIVDAAGRTVSTLFNGAATSGAQRLALNGATLANGTYSIVASNGSERATLTVVVAR
jgi:hypothetical protein